MIMLLIVALFTSYMLQQKRVEAVHETVISIFAGGKSSFEKSLELPN
jgi:sodium/hydrogen exchanger-like protein 6/7